MTIAVIVPVYKQDYIYALREQIFKEKDIAHLVVVDNGGTYEKSPFDTRIVPEENLGWLRGSNLGLKHVEKLGYTHYCLLNDDVRLSRCFFEGLLQAARGVSVGIVAPLYDGPHQHQNLEFDHAGGYEIPGISYDSEAKYVDGTCLMLSDKILQTIGYLDELNFGKYGWGADFDYCIRARQAGFKVMVTDMSFLNHLHQKTAQKEADRLGIDWNHEAGKEMRQGMVKKYGNDWESLLW